MSTLHGDGNGHGAQEQVSPPQELLVTLISTNRSTNLTLTDTELHVVSVDATIRSWQSVLFCQAPKAAHARYPYLNVLNATLQQAGDQLFVEIKVLSKGGHDGIITVKGAVDQDGHSLAEKWVQDLLAKAYGRAKHSKRLRVLINPVGGPGKAKAEWVKTVEPIFRSAGATLDVTPTTHIGHGREIAESLDVSAYDSLVIFSGDGLVHEAINGLCSRQDALLALRRCPVGVLPGGSGNASSMSVNGPRDGGNPALAALTVLKGTPMQTDICTVTQSNERFYSFLSQAYGIMADVDLGTEHMRWMGTHRFTAGFLQRALAGPVYDCEISMRIVESDKQKMREDSLATHRKALAPDFVTADGKGENPFASHEDDQDDAGPETLAMPALKYGTIQDAIPSGSGPDLAPIEGSNATGWTTLASPVCNIYAGSLPYLAENLMMFPVANNDGQIVLSIVPVVKALTLLGLFNGAESGGVYLNDKVEYYKVEAYRLHPKPSTNGLPNYISIDGESYPYEPFQVEIHAGIGRMLSLTGHWYLSDEWLKA